MRVWMPIFVELTCVLLLVTALTQKIMRLVMFVFQTKEILN